MFRPWPYRHSEAETGSNRLTVQWPNLADDVIRHFTDMGVNKCYCAYYATKPDGVLVRVVDKAVVHILGNAAVRGLTTFHERIDVLFPEVQCGFVNGDYTFLERSPTRPMEGSYLFIATPIYSDNSDEISKASESVETCAAFISLLHGEFVATERHFAALYDLTANSVSATSSAIYFRQTADQESLNRSMASILDVVETCDFAEKSTCLALIRRAHHETDSSIKFLFMWLALEAAIGDGKERKRFALETMASDTLNTTMNMLRDKRSALVHDGELVSLSHKEYLQIKCIIIMGLSQSQDLRTRLLSFIENDLIV